MHRINSLLKILLIIALLTQVAQSILTPYQNIGTCNVTCAACQTGSFNVCTICTSNLNLTNTGVCVQPKATVIYFFFWFQNLNLNATVYSKTTKWLVYNITHTKSLSYDNYYSCSGSKFYFDFIGLFKSEYQLFITVNFTQYIQQSYISFMLLRFASPFSITVTADNNIYLFGQSYYDDTFSIDPTELNEKGTVIDCTLFDLNTASSYYSKVLSNMYVVKTLSITYKITGNYTETTNTTNGTWGIRQVAVISKKCSNCISQSLSVLAVSGGIAIVALFLILIALTALVAVYMMIAKAYKQSKEEKQRYKSKKKGKEVNQNQKYYKIANKNILQNIHLLKK